MQVYNSTFGNSTLKNSPIPQTNPTFGQFQSIGSALQQQNGNFGQQNIPSVYGRMVNGEEDISPQSEVSMNGDLSLFPVSDYSCIYALARDQYGNLQKVKYVPETNQEIVNNVYDMNGSQKILDRIDDLERLIKRNNYNKKKNYNKKPYDRNNQNGSKDTDGGDE